MKPLSMTVDGVNTYDDLGLVMEVTENNPPTPKFYTVDIPGGDGNINLTKALTGDTVYQNREIKVTFTLNQPGYDFEQFKTMIYNLWHGTEQDFSFSFDEPYTYHGWLSIASQKRAGNLKQIELTIDADPYKSKGMKTEFFNVSDGLVAYLSSGRKRVKPVFEFSDSTIVVYEGKRYVIPAGTHTINDVWLNQGTNEITFVLAGLQSHITHSEMAKFTHEQLAMRKHWQLYKGIEKYYVSEIKIEGTETPLTGTINFTATDSEGNEFTQALELGTLQVAKYGDVCDTITISDGLARVQKLIEVSDDGSMTLLPLPQSVTIAFPIMFSNYGEITSLTHDSAATVTYTTGKMNTELTMRRATHSDYMEAGDYAMTNAEMSAYNHAALTMINTGEQEVTRERQESVFVQYEWLDL